jgi:septum formation protein
LTKAQLILASASPRRRQLIHQLGAEVELVESGVDEQLEGPLHPREAAVCLALRKAMAIATRYPESYVLGADTIVDRDGIALNKPGNGEEAAQMLRRLRGRTHLVHTGIAVAVPDREPVTTVSTTRVHMHDFSEKVLDRYLATGESMDKAGAYGIQGAAGDIVAAVDGCFTNVVGLPLCATARLLAETGLSITAPAPECAFRGHARCPLWPAGADQA